LDGGPIKAALHGLYGWNPFFRSISVRNRRNPKDEKRDFTQYLFYGVSWNSSLLLASEKTVISTQRFSDQEFKSSVHTNSKLEKLPYCHFPKTEKKGDRSKTFFPEPTKNPRL